MTALGPPRRRNSLLQALELLRARGLPATRAELEMFLFIADCEEPVLLRDIAARAGVTPVAAWRWAMFLSRPEFGGLVSMQKWAEGNRLLVQTTALGRALATELDEIISAAHPVARRARAFAGSAQTGLLPSTEDRGTQEL